MPFKLKLKKSRHYNVTSKSLFVISVHHLLVLDTPTTVDCTLSSESTGLECLENVCQRLSINQPEFFGLRYIVKGSDTEMRWVDLDRPLSRQLEKHAASPKLYLRIMYYVISGVTLITDEVTRNYYFLQLKSDVVDGRISCDPRQAVTLAIYCRQAQYDSYQSERHTVDYLKTLLPFPKHMIEAGLLETLTEEVLQPNPEIQSLTQSAAEGLFITACQQLDGYGQERFNAKNDSNHMVSLGITVAGIIVTTLDGSYTFYPWHEISNVVNHKRIFNIECTDPQKSVGFTLHDADTGRYFWKLCVLQHTFFMKYEQNQVHPNVEQSVNLFQNVPEDLNESRDNLFEQSSNIYASDSHIPASLLWNQSHQQLHPHQTESIVSSNMSLAASQQQLRSAYEHGCTPVPNEFTHRNSNWRLVGSNTSLNNGRTQSTSCLDLSNNNIQHERERERLKAFLPGYRPAPDYETAVQQKYRSNTHINSYSGSQPDVHQATAITDAIFGHQLQQKYPDVTQTTNPIYQQHFADPSIIGIDGLSHQLQLMRFNKPPPPPYHTNRFSSTSTPDLASHQLLGYRGAYGSSPDLVSTRTFVNQPPQFMSQQQVYPVSSTQSQTFRYRYAQGVVPHGTYENLNFIDGHMKTNLLSQKMQNGYRNGSPLTNGPTKPHNGSIEPIYENIPLPWQSENNSAEMRDRASSIQSAPGVMRFKTQPHLNPNYLNETNKSAHAANVSAMKRQVFAEHAMLSKSTSNPIEQTHHHPHQNHQPQQQQQHNHHQLPTHHSNESNCETDGRSTTGNGTVIAINSNSTFEPNVEIIQPPKQFQQGDKPVHKTRIEIVAANQNESMSITNNNNNNNNHNNNNSSNNNNNNHHHDISNRSNSLSKSNILETSQSSTFTNQTATTTDSGVSVDQKEKKKRRWVFFGGGSNSSSKSNTNNDKQKSATLGREKDKDKDKDKSKGSKSKTIARDEQSSLKHRWSTGLPKLQPLAATISKEKLSQILEEKLHDSKMFMEFESIPKRKDGARYDCALHEENRMKNSDPNFLPYDDNRVRVTPSVGNRLGYVNASNIQVTVGKKQRFYIVAQSPHNTQTLHTFWQCVWEADVYLIVQLSEEINYIPATTDKCLNYGQYQVFQEFTQNTGRCITSKFRLYHTQSRRYRSVWHLKYSNWAEQNCPLDVEHFLDFLKELNSVRLASINEVPPGHNTNPPCLIHCSEGGGRAGVTLCCDLLLYTMDHNQDLDIPRVVGQLRHQRDNIIPSLAQYKFIYSLLINSLKQTRLI